MGVDQERAARCGLVPSPWDTDTTTADRVETAQPGLGRATGSIWRAYTDGSVQPNPGAGGWAAIIIAPNGTRQELSGAEARTTSSRMELAAILAAVKAVPEGASITVTSDSEYAVRVSSGRYRAKKNKDLVHAIWRAAETRRVKYQWVRGHNGHALNERADQLANRARRR